MVNLRDILFFGMFFFSILIFASLLSVTYTEQLSRKVSRRPPSRLGPYFYYLVVFVDFRFFQMEISRGFNTQQKLIFSVLFFFSSLRNQLSMSKRKLNSPRIDSIASTAPRAVPTGSRHQRRCWNVCWWSGCYCHWCPHWCHWRLWSAPF